MEAFINFLSKELISTGNVTVTVGQVLLAPLAIILVLALSGWLIRRVSKRLDHAGHDANIVLLFKRAAWIVVLTALFFTTLALLDVPLGAFAFVSGAVAIGVGFGAQNILNNFISGWILMGERPIRIGDLLEIQDMLGTVEAINTRSTRIRRIDGVRIVLPNSYLLENTVINWTLVDNEVRIFVAVGVAYGSPVRKVQKLIMQAVTEQEDVLAEPEPSILFQDFGDSSLVFEAYFWTMLRPGGDHRKLRSEVRFRIDELFRENDIVIAFPQRDVHLDGAVRVLGSSEPAVADEKPDLGSQ